MKSTSNITRAIKAEAKKYNLEVKRSGRKDDIVTYEFLRLNSDISEATSIELIIDISIYRNEFLKPLVEKANYEVGKCEKEVERRIKQFHLRRQIFGG